MLRVPNEKGEQNTYKVTLFVPTALQEVISVKQQGDWSVRLKRRDTGKKNEEGEPVYAITSISWIAKKGSEIKPGFFGEFFIRFQNPVQPGKFCFPINQYYRAKGFSKLSKRQQRSAKPELVAWTGPPDAEFPASCITTAAAPADRSLMASLPHTGHGREARAAARASRPLVADRHGGVGARRRSATRSCSRRHRAPPSSRSTRSRSRASAARTSCPCRCRCRRTSSR